MTLGIFAPLIAAFGSLLVVPMFVRRLRALPGSTDAGYDEVSVSAQRRGMTIIILAELALPVLLYIMLNFVTDAGTLVLF